MTLEDRIVKLESKFTPQITDPLYIVRVMLEDVEHEQKREPEYQHLQSGGRSWTRREDESEDDFKQRATREATRSTGPLAFTVNRPLARLLQAP